jgi:hypothetical protein
MNYLQLAQRLRAEAGLSGTGPASVASQTGMDKKLVDWVSTAWEEIQTLRNDWRFNWTEGTIPLTAGVDSYLPSNLGISDLNVWVLDTFRIEIGTEKHWLGYVPWPDFKRQYETTQQNRPSVFTIAPDLKIHLSQVPDQAYTLKAEYFKTPQILVDNGDIPRCPERYHMAIVYKALMMYSAHDDALQTFADANIRFTSLLNKMESTELSRIFNDAGGLDAY